tara:strand:- start:135 stop:764 length:630 start_codon:yes stop_codon:yes gene_type:complete
MIVELVGPPGSGKSTILKEIVKQNKKFIAESEVPINFLSFYVIYTLIFLSLKYFITFRIYKLNELKTNLYYFQNFVKKFLRLKIAVRNNLILIQDDGLISNTISSRALLNNKYLESYIFLKNQKYIVFKLVVPKSENLKRLNNKAISASWKKIKVTKTFSEIITSYSKILDLEINIKNLKKYDVQIYEIENVGSSVTVAETILRLLDGK